MWIVKDKLSTVVKYVFDKEAKWSKKGMLMEPELVLDITNTNYDILEVVSLNGYILPINYINDTKKQKLYEIKQSFINASIKPIVETGLGFSVDGGYANKTDFETGKKYSFPQVRGADNMMYNVTLTDYDTIISAIEMNGIALYQKKWQLEEAVNSATTIEELEAITW